MKKILMVIVFSLLITLSNFAAEINVKIDGKFVNFTGIPKPYMEKGTVSIPLRVVSENLKAEVKWNKYDKYITLSKDGKVIKLKIGSELILVSDKRWGSNEYKNFTTAVAPIMKKDYTFVPFRFVADNFDLDVKWEDKTSTVVLESQNYALESYGYKVPEGKKIIVYDTPKKEELKNNPEISLYFDYSEWFDKSRIIPINYQFEYARKILRSKFSEPDTKKIMDVVMKKTSKKTGFEDTTLKIGVYEIWIRGLIKGDEAKIFVYRSGK